MEPSFQVMGDMLDKITVQLQQQRTSSDDDDDDGTLKINRATNTGSMDSLKSDSAPNSPRTADRGLPVPANVAYTGQKTQEFTEKQRYIGKRFSVTQ